MIREFGLHWSADAVSWSRKPALMGKLGRARCDFFMQQGVYVLYRGDNPLYVGEALKQTIGQRIRFHQRNKRSKYPDEPSKWWNQFSWFGFKEAVATNDRRFLALSTLSHKVRLTAEEGISELEALLIKTLQLNNTRPERFRFGREWKQCD